MTTYTLFTLHNGLDINDADSVEFLLSHDRQQVWVNIDGILCIRIIGIKTLVLPGEHDQKDLGALPPDPNS